MIKPPTEARHLVAARLARRTRARLPEAHRPADVEGALAIQQRVGELLCETIGGWKCSVPTEDRKAPAAPIYTSTIHRGSPCPVVPVGVSARIEPEIAFVIGADLPSRDEPYTEAEVRAAIFETRAVLELLGSRYSDAASVTFSELLADSISNQGLLVGPVVVNAMELSLAAFPVSIRASGEEILAREGRHPDGHPLLPLYWLVNHLSTRGMTLAKGQIVTTGSYCGAVDVPLNADVEVSWDDFARLEVRFFAD